MVFLYYEKHLPPLLCKLVQIAGLFTDLCFLWSPQDTMELPEVQVFGLSQSFSWSASWPPAPSSCTSSKGELRESHEDRVRHFSPPPLCRNNPQWPSKIQKHQCWSQNIQCRNNKNRICKEQRHFRHFWHKIRGVLEKICSLFYELMRKYASKQNTFVLMKTVKMLKCLH